MTKIDMNNLIKKKVSKWQIIFYISMAVLTIWLILKVVGIIKTPFWLEFGVLIASLIVGIFAFYHNLIENTSKLLVGFAILSEKFSRQSAKISHIERDFYFVKTDIEFLKKR